MSSDRVNPISPIPSNEKHHNDKLPQQDTPPSEKRDSPSEDKPNSGDGITRDKDGNYTGVDTHV